VRRVTYTAEDTAPVPSFLVPLPTARRAYDLARAAHARQRRESDAAPFIVHPLEVAALLQVTGHSEPVIAAGILHDTVEDSDTTVEEIAAGFGPGIAAIVGAMTEDPAIADFAQRKRALREQIARHGPDATAVYAADKVAKVRELRSRAARGEDVLQPANRAAHEKLEHYRHSLQMLEQITPEHPLVGQLRFELEILRALPPRPELLGAEG
jgi:(p)ppGpp synthase/HD superfamily hydrolase